MAHFVFITNNTYNAAAECYVKFRTKELSEYFKYLTYQRGLFFGDKIDVDVIRIRL